jgi:hypothetical protein
MGYGFIVFILFFIISNIFLAFRYDKKHTDNNGWKICHDCGCAESLMTYTTRGLITEYRCSKCASTQTRIRKLKTNKRTNLKL